VSAIGRAIIVSFNCFTPQRYFFFGKIQYVKKRFLRIIIISPPFARRSVSLRRAKNKSPDLFCTNPVNHNITYLTACQWDEWTSFYPYSVSTRQIAII